VIFFHLLTTSSSLLFTAAPPTPPPTPVFPLFADYNEYNPSGITCYRGKEVCVNDGKHGEEVVDVLTIGKMVADFRDAEENRYSAKLHPTGTSIEIFEPSISHAMRYNVTEVHALEEGGVCEKTKMAHQIHATAMNAEATDEEPARKQTKSMILRFEQGIKCSTAFFHVAGSGKQLDMPTYREMPAYSKKTDPVTGLKCIGNVGWLYWKLAIVGTRQLVQQAATSANTRTDLDDLALRMSRLRPAP
jgi:hypothetical protein